MSDPNTAAACICPDGLNTAVMCISLTVLNLGTIFLLRYALKEADLPSMLSEKTSQSRPLASRPGILGPDPPLPTSFSRVAGIVGAIVLVVFFWGLANAILYDAFTYLDHIKQIVQNTWQFFLVGSALFAPYAFNQLTSIFK